MNIQKALKEIIERINMLEIKAGLNKPAKKTSKKK